MAERKGTDGPVFHSGKDANEGKEGDKSAYHHHKETHGTSDDIDKNTPIDEVKGPGVFGRVKEEIEAVVEAIVHPNK